MRWRGKRQGKIWPGLVVKIASVIPLEGLFIQVCVNLLHTQEPPQCPKEPPSGSPVKMQMIGFQIFLIQKIRDEACGSAFLTRPQVSCLCWQVQGAGYPRPGDRDCMIASGFVLKMILVTVLERTTWGLRPNTQQSCVLSAGERAQNPWNSN